MTKIYEVRVRNGSRGQSSLAAIVATKKEAASLKKMLTKENGKVQIIIREQCIETIQEFDQRKMEEHCLRYPYDTHYNRIKEKYWLYSLATNAYKKVSTW
jgi:hypothetical protein